MSNDNKKRPQTDTPRTDAAMPDDEKRFAPHFQQVDADFARQLERELAATQQQLHALRLVCGTTDANKFETWVDRANAERDAWRKVAEGLAERLNSKAIRINGGLAHLVPDNEALAAFDKLSAKTP